MTAIIKELSLGGPGPTIVIKDTIDIAGLPTTASSRALGDAAPAQRHAEVVERLLSAGWHITGKASMHELAFGMTGINDHTGTPVNPQDASRIPGGSSSGSASAVGFKLADAALGTDTGGSVRGPAACCGVIGLKPTFGRVSRRGVAPSKSTLDCVGPFARDMKTIVRAMDAIASTFDVDAAEAPVPSCNVAIVAVDACSDIQAALMRSVAQAEVTARHVQLMDFAAAFEAGLAVINAETFAAFGHLIETGKLGADVAARLRAAASTTPQQLEHAQAVRERFIAQVDAALDSADVLVLPTLPDLPLTLADAKAGVSVIGMSSLIRPFNLSGHPAISLPLPLAESTLKAGLQIVGKKGDDERVCAVAAHFERALARG
jgi:amidase